MNAYASRTIDETAVAFTSVVEALYGDLACITGIFIGCKGFVQKVSGWTGWPKQKIHFYSLVLCKWFEVTLRVRLLLF